MAEETSKAAGEGPQKPHKPGLTLLEVLVALIVIGGLVVVVRPVIIRRQRERAFQLARAEIRYASAARAKELITAFPQLANARGGRYGGTPLRRAAAEGQKDPTAFSVVKVFVF